MTGIENVDSLAVCTRVIQVFFGSFIYIFLVAKQVGPENKKPCFTHGHRKTIGVVFSFPTPALPGSGSWVSEIRFSPSQPRKTQHPCLLAAQ